MTVDELQVVITANTAGLTTAMAGVTGQMNAMKAQTNSASSGMQKAFGKVGKIALAAGASIVAGFGAALISGVKGAMEGEDAIAQLDAVLKSTGGSAGVARKDLLGLADQFQKTTKFTQEEVLASESLLLTFTNIGKDTFPRATKAAGDMATALGTDMAGQSVALGKALNDPTKGITALTRVGVTFDAGQKKSIKAMQEHGDMAGAQAIILKELEKEFGGSATAAGKTLSGQLEILKNAFGEVQEALALQVMPYLQKFLDWINGNMPTIQAVTSTAFKVIGTAFDIVIKVIGTVVNGFIKFKVVLIPIMAVVAAVIVNAWVVTTAKAITSAVIQGIQSVKVMASWIKIGAIATIHAIKQVAAWVMVGLGAIKSAAITVAQSIVVVAKWVLMGAQALLHAAKQVAAWVLTGVGAIAAGVIMVAQSAIVVAKWVWMGVQSLLGAAKMAAAWIIALGPIGWVMIAVAAIGVFIALNWAKVKAVTVAVFTAVGSWIKSKWTEIKTVITTVVGNIKTAISSKFNEIKTSVTTIVNGIKSTITSVWNGIKSTTSSVFNAVKNSIMTPINSAVSLVSSAVSRIKGFFSGMHISFPKIKMPHFSISGSFSLAPPSMPKLGVSWYQNGGVFDKASMIGVGENGSEAVVPLERNLGWVDKMASKITDKMGNSGNGLNLTITNFVNNRSQDVQSLAEELSFYMKQKNLGGSR